MDTRTVKLYTRIGSSILLVIGVSAVLGGLGLIITNGLGMPIHWLLPAFHSYLVPGLILLCIVGGTHLHAALLLWRGASAAPYSVAIAGFAMVIWVFSELYIIRQPHWLQWFYFGIGIATLAGNMLLLKTRTHPSAP